MSKIEANSYYSRAKELVIITSNSKVLLKTSSACFTLEKIPANAVSFFFRELEKPVRGEALKKLLATLPAELSALLPEFMKEGIILKNAKSPSRKKAAKPACPHLVIGITGTVNAPYMVTLAAELLATGFSERISVILTPSALKFVGKIAFEGYGIEVFCDSFEKEKLAAPPHIRLGESADLMLIMPASAHLLHRLASGSCSDLLSLTAISTRAPLVVVPSCNQSMYEHPAVQRNLKIVRQDGAYILEPEKLLSAYDLAKGQAHEPTGYGFNPRLKNLSSILFEILMAHKR